MINILLERSRFIYLLLQDKVLHTEFNFFRNN